MESRTRFLASHAVLCTVHSLHVPTAALRKPAPYLISLLLRGRLPRWSSFLEASLSRQPGKARLPYPGSPRWRSRRNPAGICRRPGPRRLDGRGTARSWGGTGPPGSPAGGTCSYDKGRGPGLSPALGHPQSHLCRLGLVITPLLTRPHLCVCTCQTASLKLCPGKHSLMKCSPRPLKKGMGTYIHLDYTLQLESHNAISILKA